MSHDQRQRFRSGLSAASRAFKAAAVEQMRAVGVHAGQNFLLAELRDEEPLTTGELARRMHVEVPTVVKMAQRMESAGLLDRRPDPGDGRRVLISLTPRGREAAEQIPALLDAVSDQALAGLDDTERETLSSLLQRVTAGLGWPPPPSRKR
jgi:MarR family transcriptional regulator, organic hydroperoxide resistance regulator